MADFGGDDLFAVFEHVESKKDEKASDVSEGSVKDSVKRIFQQRGEKRGLDDSGDGILRGEIDCGDDKLKKIKKTDDER